MAAHPYLKARIYEVESASIGLSKWKKAALICGGGAILGVGAVVAAPLVLTGIGFTAGGIAAGSTAAAIQGSIGNVVAGSLFASLQSAGAAGLGMAGVAASSAAGAAVGGAVGGIVSSGKWKIPVQNIEKTFDIRDTNQDGYVEASLLQSILIDLEVTMSDSEFRKEFQRVTHCPYNESTPVSYEEYLAIFGIKIYKRTDLRDILRNLFIKIVEEKGMFHSSEIKDILHILNVNASEEYVEICIRSVLNGELDGILKLEEFLKVFRVSEADLSDD